MHRWSLILLLIAIASSRGLADDPRGTASHRDVAVLRTTRIECTVGNNKSYQQGKIRHRAGYNGLFRLVSKDQQTSPFVTSYAGVNLEHYFDARARSEPPVFFEPRYSEMTLREISPTCVELHQPTTAAYGVESWTRFEVREPYYIDFRFRCIPRRGLQGDFLGIFWASYINGPTDKSIYFLDQESSLERPMWRQFCTQAHNRDSTVRGKRDTATLPFEETGNALFSSFSPLGYSESFFYGRFRNMVLIYVFQPNPHLRFTHSPSGGGTNERHDDTNPAWDFQLVVPQAKVGQEYGLRGCLVYKPWAGRADVLNEVRRFQARTQSP